MSLYCFLTVLALMVSGTNLLASAESIRVTGNGIVFPDGTTQITAATGGVRNYAPVKKTGQTVCYGENGEAVECSGTGQDGEYQKGVAWPTPRFTDNFDGTVTDNLTRLIWLKNAGCFGKLSWTAALSACNGLASGSCGLSDGSSPGEWRLPNRYELESLLDMSVSNRALPPGHPFTGVSTESYWTSTTYATVKSHAWQVRIFYGYVYYDDKELALWVWPVRGVQ